MASIRFGTSSLAEIKERNAAYQVLAKRNIRHSYDREYLQAFRYFQPALDSVINRQGETGWDILAEIARLDQQQRARGENYPNLNIRDINSRFSITGPVRDWLEYTWTKAPSGGDWRNSIIQTHYGKGIYDGFFLTGLGRWIIENALPSRGRDIPGITPTQPLKPHFDEWRGKQKEGHGKAITPDIKPEDASRQQAMSRFLKFLDQPVTQYGDTGWEVLSVLAKAGSNKPLPEMQTGIGQAFMDLLLPNHRQMTTTELTDGELKQLFPASILEVKRFMEKLADTSPYAMPANGPITIWTNQDGLIYSKYILNGLGKWALETYFPDNDAN